MLCSGVRPASRDHRVLNYVLSCVLANSKVSLLRLRQTCEKSFSPVCVPRPAPLHVLNCVLVCVLNCVLAVPLLWLRQTGEKSFAPVCVPRPVPLHVLNCILVCVLNCVR